MGKMNKISEHTYLIEGENGGKYPYCNCLFIDDDKKVLIDSGAGKNLKQGFIKPNYIFNSHWHEDHITYNDLFNAEIYIHNQDASAITSYEEFKQRYGLFR
jgi:glyoxylase-like metal-dependent hydrolase (beta-lactamase superfamily II)